MNSTTIDQDLLTLQSTVKELQSTLAIRELEIIKLKVDMSSLQDDMDAHIHMNDELARSALQTIKRVDRLSRTPISPNRKQGRLQVLLVLQSHFMESLKEAYNDIKVITNRLEQWEQEIQTIIGGDNGTEE